MPKLKLIELIPLICFSAIWAQYPEFSRPEPPYGASLGVTEVIDSLTVGILFPS